MTLSQGARLGPYEIAGLIGVGGMGEVYRARDTRLDRTVAIKVLPDNMSAEPDRRARFEREARAIATLSHPHICTLYDVGEHASALFLVMEHLAGETLAERLARGPLPIDEALACGAQIADALSAAHRAGIVHRDLKPGNVMLTKSGVKLLDFGLAKAVRVDGAPARSVLSTAPADLTARGTILGTFQYMAPEQLEGLESDARTDIFAFGGVLYEMITGARAFQGKTTASVIGAIMHGEPPAIATLRPQAPPLVEHLVSRCLAKNPDDRWQTAGDVARELKWMATAPDADRSPAAVTSAFYLAWWRRAAYATGLIGVLLAGAVAWLVADPRFARHDAARPELPIRLTVTPPLNTRLSSVQLAFSPDGTRVAYVGLAGEQRQIWVYSLATGESRLVAGAEDAHFPFWSPDSRHIGYVTGTTLMRVSADGGPPQALAPASALSSGAWSDESVILFAGRDKPGIYRIPSGGGPAVPVTTLDASHGELLHLHPRFLPGGRRFMYLVRSRDPAYTGVYVRSLDADDHKLLVHTPGQAEYAPGSLLFVRDAVLFAQRFDLAGSELTGDPVPIAQPANVNSDNGGAAVSVSRDGSLVYYARADAPGALEWVDRQGNRGATVNPRGVYRGVELSPDDRKALAKIRGKDVTIVGDIWTIDLSRGVSSQLTSNAESFNARWSPDGQYVFFDSHRSGASGIYRKRSDGSGREELIWRTTGVLSDVSRTGSLLIDEGQTCTVVEWSGTPVGRKFVESPSMKACGRFSDDGRLAAFTQTDSGRSEVYVVPFPEGTPRLQVSNNGGREPRWRRDGKELFYLRPDGTMMSVALTRTPTLQAWPPKPLFQAVALTSGPFAQYSVSRDGMRFLMIDPFEDPRTESFTVIAHWSQSVPAKGS